MSKYYFFEEKKKPAFGIHFVFCSNEKGTCTYMMILSIPWTIFWFKIRSYITRNCFHKVDVLSSLNVIRIFLPYHSRYRFWMLYAYLVCTINKFVFCTKEKGTCTNLMVLSIPRTIFWFKMSPSYHNMADLQVFLHCWWQFQCNMHIFTLPFEISVLDTVCLFVTYLKICIIKTIL